MFLPFWLILPGPGVFMLGVTHNQVDVETEFGVIPLILIFLYILALI